MSITHLRVHYIRIVIFFILSSFLSTSVFGGDDLASGPVIASVNINSCVGSITISVTSGTAPYSYVWKDSGGTDLGVNSFFIDGLAADNYEVTVTDADGKSVTATYTVTDPPDLVGSVVVNDVTCKNASDAQVIITMANGNPPYDWELYNDNSGAQVSTGSSSSPIITLGGLGVGDYRFEVADLNGCTGTIYFSITEPIDFLAYNGASVTDATCFNSSDGAISINVTGGWGNYSYRWIRVSDNAVVATNEDATGLAPGAYYLEISDANPSGNPCIVNTTNYTVGSPDEIVPTAAITDALCNGNSDGEIDLSVTGGVSPYTYLWSTGATTQDISGLAAGSYTVTITDNSGCTDVETFTVGEPAVLTLNPDFRDVDCFGQSTGRIRSRPSGGTEPYTYSWSNGRTGKNNNNIPAGTYSVTVTDANGCTATATGLVITQPSAPLSKASDTLNDPSCFGGTDGSATISMTGGTTPYTYAWSNGDNTATATGLSAGIHSVTVTDANGCAITEFITLNDPVRIGVTPTLTPPSCNGLSDGSISVSASNGTAPYSYSWNTGDSGPNLTNIVAGNYSVTVTDAGGCSVVENFTLGEPGVLSGNAVVNDITCNGANDGSIFLAVSGGTTPYTYSWSTGSTSNNVSGLVAGNYSVTITDGSGCSIVENYTVIDPAPIGLTYTQTDLVCKGGSSGNIDISPSGGTLPYSYVWSNGATSQDLVNVAAGTYTVTVKDAENCSVNLTVTLTEPATTLDLSATQTNVTCNGSNNGEIDLEVVGGATPYTYLWSTGAVTQDVTGLAPGNYSVSVTDGNGCIKSLGFTITQPGPLSSTNTVNDVSCFGNADGTINVAPTGGTSPYTYQWADDIGEVTASRSALGPGSYTVTITDSNGCQLVQNISVTEPTALNATTSQADVSCFGESTGAIDLTISGGVTPYTFNWSNGAVTEDLSSIPAGSYSVTVTDANGCTISENVTISEPSAALAISGAANQITCNGAADGIINITVSGGTAPYSYNWSNGSTSEDLNSLPSGTYTLTVTDNNGCTATESYSITDPPVLTLSGVATDALCNGSDDGQIDITVGGGEGPYSFTWSNGATTEDISGLAPGSYTVNISDNRGCTVNQTFTIQEPLALGLSYTSNQVDCYGDNSGSIDITVIGGTSPYTYTWSTGSGNEDLSGLSAGSYNVIVTDVNGCSITENFTITEPSAALTDNSTVSDISCFGGSDGSIELNPSGGTAPYSYAWNTGATTKDIFGLTTGTYQVTITDFNGCSYSANYTINMPPALQASGVDTDILCNGGTDGAVDLTVTGGTLPYTFTWSNGATTEDISSVPAGNYQVTITDGAGCSLTRSFEITEPLVLSLGSSQSDVTCFGSSNGFIQTNVSGGVAPYDYVWSNGETTDGIYNLSGGSYTLTLTDGNGCQTIETYTITEPATALSATATVTDENCFGDRQGAIDMNVSGGTAPYTISWNQGSSTEDIAGLGRGVYQANITDANGCSIQANFTVGGPDQITINASVNDVTCNGASDGQIDITATGGIGSYTYLWSNGETTEDLSNLSPGSYAITVMDDNGCSNTSTFTIQEPLSIQITSNLGDVTCFDASNGYIETTISGGVAPYDYSWSNGASTDDIYGLSGGDYTLTVTDNNGCEIVQVFNVFEPSAPLTATAVISDEICFGDRQGIIDLTVSGGTSPYQFTWNQGSDTEDIAGLSSGTYQVNITDANGCTIQENYVVESPEPLRINSILNDVTCFGEADGQIDITPTGGIGPYTYLWSNGETTEDLSGLAPGSYAITVMDDNGCSNTATFTIQEPLVLTVNYTKSDVSCFGSDDGLIDVTVSGGNLPYTYAWSNGMTTEDISSLPGGDYTLIVTDDKGCQATQIVSILAPSEALGADVVISDVNCFGQPGGQVQVTPKGGTGPYTYNWSNGSNQEDQVGLFAGTYALTITDSKGCTFQETYTISQPDELNITFDITSTSCFGDSDGQILPTVEGGTAPYSYIWSNGSTSKDQIDIASGTYNLTVIDNNGCSITKAAVVGDSQDLIVQVNKRDVSCKGDSSGLIELDVTGGSGAYTYAWDNGADTGILSDLPAGVYSVVVSDAGGCAATASVVISEPAQALSATVSGTSELSCFGDQSGFLEANVTGGVSPYTYLWSNGERTSAIAAVGAGEYTVSIKDANDCLVQINWNIVQPEAPISIQATGKLNLDCKDDSDGSIEVAITGGSGNYDILWSTGESSNSISGLSVGDYTIRVRDEKGCIEERVFTITQPDELTLGNAVINESQCYNDRNGSIELNVNGGTAPYTYQWETGQTTKNRIGISSGTYSVLVTDKNGCQVQGTYTLASPELFAMEPEISPISCIGANDASIALNIEGGIEPLVIKWSTGAASETISNLNPGSYNVLITDKTGCTLQRTFNIVEPRELVLDAFVRNADECNNPESGRVNVIVTGGTKPYRYRWSNGDTTSTIENVLPGTYVVEVTDKFGCSQQGTYTVLQPKPLQIGLSSAPYIDCDNRIAGMLITADVTGGLGNYTYNWSRGTSSGGEILMTAPGRLTLEIFDGRGCYQLNSIDIDIPELGEADFDYNARSLDETGELAIKDPVSFFDQSLGDIIDWSWDFGDGFDSKEVDPIHVYDAPGRFIVTLITTDRTGCTSSKTSVLDLTEGYKIILPNAFTPNGDGNNDFFRPEMLGMTQVQLVIFNTWGEIVFNTDDVETRGWDGYVNGRRAENGNYVYKLSGVSFNGLPVERDGVFALLK